MAASSPYFRSPLFPKTEEIISLYKEGIVLTEIAKVYNTNYLSIRNLLHSNNIEIIQNNIRSRKYTLNEEYFSEINTEEKAYFLGLLYADGYVNENKRTIVLSLKSDDVKILEYFTKCIESTKPLSFINEKNGRGSQFSFCVTSRKITEDLIKLGCIPRKSLVLKFPTEEQVPQHLVNHFIRGYFDGDGCITFNLNTRKFKFSLAGTFDFLFNTKRIIEKEASLNNIKIHPHKNIFYLEYTGIPQCNRIYKYLYENSSVYLDRKIQKFKIIQDVSK
jgi:intein-encoded DNA endonuclease-like protein